MDKYGNANRRIVMAAERAIECAEFQGRQINDQLNALAVSWAEVERVHQGIRAGLSAAADQELAQVIDRIRGEYPLNGRECEISRCAFDVRTIRV